jgi:transcriptional regulator EpsA
MNRVTALSTWSDSVVPTRADFAASHGTALVRLIEAGADVQRRHQFFTWSQSYLHSLVPHQLAICGAYQRSRRDVAFEVFNSVPVPTGVLSSVTDGGSALIQQLVQAWIERRGHALLQDLSKLPASTGGPDRDLFLEAGFVELLVHGVSRPQRPAEVESLFIFGSPRGRCSADHAGCLELLMPHLHATWLRVQSVERELAGARTSTPAPAVGSRSLITERENQILFWVREGKSNHEIGDQLGISVLTVKNHVQKILRKLGAANRAQAVAKAMTMNMLHAPRRSAE